MDIFIDSFHRVKIRTGFLFPGKPFLLYKLPAAGEILIPQYVVEIGLKFRIIQTNCNIARKKFGRERAVAIGANFFKLKLIGSFTHCTHLILNRP